MIDLLSAKVQPGDQVIFMSNGGFEAAPRRFVERLRQD
jgi:UDP-N-acetylmuramate: L-alanyl-gamma-D-glutamyl-meso-diaminopimelate ligase